MNKEFRGGALYLLSSFTFHLILILRKYSPVREVFYRIALSLYIRVFLCFFSVIFVKNGECFSAAVCGQSKQDFHLIQKIYIVYTYINCFYIKKRKER